MEVVGPRLFIAAGRRAFYMLALVLTLSRIWSWTHGAENVCFRS
jgi:hypothetical protein